MTRKLSVSLVAGAAVLVGVSGLSGGANAAENVDITASVVGACTLTAQALAFGNYVNGQAAAKDGEADLTYDCATGLDVTLTLSAGGSTDENARLMEHTTSAGNFLAYQLFQDSARTTVWGTGAAGLNIASTPGGGAQTHTVFGQIAGNQGVLEGSYDDLVVYDLTVN